MRYVAFGLLLLAGLLVTRPASPQTEEKRNPPSERHAGDSGCHWQAQLTQASFESVMRTIQNAWKEGNAQEAAECFNEDAIFSAPPASGRKGRKNLYQYFGGDGKQELKRQIEWHHLIFDPAHQIGVAEYTLHYHLQSHGVVIVKIDHGLISNWREYAIASDLSWDSFVGTNAF
jgi:hypothetical protein